VSLCPDLTTCATLTITATFSIFDVLWKEPDEDQAVAVPRPDDTPHELHKPARSGRARLKIKLSPVAHDLDN
jgi:hypothetical protein